MILQLEYCLIVQAKFLLAVVGNSVIRFFVRGKVNTLFFVTISPFFFFLFVCACVLVFAVRYTMQ